MAVWFKQRCWVVWGVMFTGLIMGCAAKPAARPVVFEQTGLASYYSDALHGRKTASGELYDKNKLTAAHRHLAFGTRVAVRNLKNGHSVHVRINDRGPFVKGRIIDLSEAAARRLGMLQSGLATVQIISVHN
jgi:rare lipoprotein A